MLLTASFLLMVKRGPHRVLPYRIPAVLTMNVSGFGWWCNHVKKIRVVSWSSSAYRLAPNELSAGFSQSAKLSSLNKDQIILSNATKLGDYFLYILHYLLTTVQKMQQKTTQRHIKLSSQSIFHVHQCYNHSSESLLPHPGGKSSMAAFEQVVLMVRTGSCSCRFFHVYGKAMSTADSRAACDISVSKMCWEVRKGGQISQTWWIHAHMEHS